MILGNLKSFALMMRILVVESNEVSSVNSIRERT